MNHYKRMNEKWMRAPDKYQELASNTKNKNNFKNWLGEF